MKRSARFIIVIFIMFLVGCSDSYNILSKIDSNENMIRRIEVQIRKDEPAIAHLKAIYGISFVNYTENDCLGNFSRCKIFQIHDNFYIRKDIASVFYGYSFSNAKLEIKTQNDKKILSVILPEPERISIDRKIISTFNNYPEYRPQINGSFVNVENHINTNLDEYIKRSETNNIKLTKIMSQNYFKALAEKNGLELHLEFHSTGKNGR